jgi:hypothetical protein
MIYGGFSTQADLEHAEKFFDGRHVTKYNMALAQALDSVLAKERWIAECFYLFIIILAAAYGCYNSRRTMLRSGWTSGRMVRSSDARARGGRSQMGMIA